MTNTKQGPVYTSTIHRTNNNPTKSTRTHNDDTVKCKDSLKAFGNKGDKAILKEIKQLHT